MGGDPIISYAQRVGHCADAGADPAGFKNASLPKNSGDDCIGRCKTFASGMLSL